MADSVSKKPKTTGYCYLHSIRKFLVCVPCEPNQIARKTFLDVEYCQTCEPGTRPSSYMEYCVDVSSSNRMAPNALGAAVMAVLLYSVS